MELIRWDPFELAAKHDVRRNTILHIGAHEGEEITQYKNLGYPETLWVEPQPEAFLNLIKKAGNSHCLKVAVWEESGLRLEFNQTNNSVSSSLYKLLDTNLWKQQICIDNTFQVETLTLFDVIEIFEMRKVLGERFVLRLDAQGSEYRILKKSGKLLKRIDFICCEVTRRKKIYEGAEKRSKIVRLLLRQGWIPLFNRINPVKSHGETIFIPINRLPDFWKLFFYMRLVSFVDYSKYYIRKFLTSRLLTTEK
jgi:FkbM family methyltransferase